MGRLTSNNYHEMDMHQLALNQVYVGLDGRAWYVNSPEDRLSVCDLIRNAAEALDVELPVLNDDELCDLMVEFLQYGEEEPEGVLAILHRALLVMAELRDRLLRYEDTGLESEEILTPVELAGAACGLQKLKQYEALGTVEELTALARTEPNPPLTLAELREMDGEPVYIRWIGCARHLGRGWAFVHTKWGGCKMADGPVAFFGRYGETWLAYRRKPEEGA